MKRPILVYPDAKLKQTSAVVLEENEEAHEAARVAAHIFGVSSVVMSGEAIYELTRDLIDTLKATPSGVGLAAVQIGVHARVAIVDVRRLGVEPFVFVNPEIAGVGAEEPMMEGCLSFPGVFERVYRHPDVIVKAYDAHMRPFVLNTQKLEGFTNKERRLIAHACQHEFEHFAGMLFIDKLTYTARERAKRKFFGRGL